MFYNLNVNMKKNFIKYKDGGNALKTRFTLYEIKLK